MKMYRRIKTGSQQIRRRSKLKVIRCQVLAILALNTTAKVTKDLQKFVSICLTTCRLPLHLVRCLMSTIFNDSNWKSNSKMPNSLFRKKAWLGTTENFRTLEISNIVNPKKMNNITTNIRIALKWKKMIMMEMRMTKLYFKPFNIILTQLLQVISLL